MSGTSWVALSLDGRQCRVRYDWAAIEALRQALGDDFDRAIGEAVVAMDLKVLGQALVIGLESEQPGEYTLERIKALSPAVVPMQDAITRALMLAYHGQEEAPETGGNPRQGPVRRLIRTASRAIAKRLSGRRSGKHTVTA